MIHTDEDDEFERIEHEAKMRQGQPYHYDVYVSPSQRTWVGLTEEEILSDDILRYYYGMNGGAGPVSQKGKKVVAAIEAKLKEKNT